MSQERLLSMLRSRRGPDFATLDEYFEKSGEEVFDRMNEVARRSPTVIDDEALAWALNRIAHAPASVFFLLLNVAAGDEERRDAVLARYRASMKDHPGPALRVAGIHLHEYNRLLDGEWIEAADRLFDHDPEGAWGIFESAAMYRPTFIGPAHVEAFERRRAAMPRDYFVSMLSLAGHWPERAPELLSCVLRAFPQHPAEALDGASSIASGRKPLLVPDLVAAVVRHFDAAAEKAWAFFDGACRAKPTAFDDALLDVLSSREDCGDGKLFDILDHLMSVRPEEVRPLMDRYVAMVRRHPGKGIDAARWDFTREEARLIRPDLVRAVCDGFAHSAYKAYEFLWQCLDDRPELIGPPEVDAALRNIEHATNRAFGFFQHLAKLRPEFTRESIFGFFEALAREPDHRAFNREEFIQEIIAVSQALHVKTGLESALREPLRRGSRRAQALMAILFRQKLRARRHVLLEALRYAGKIVLWRKAPPEKFSPVWDFLMFIVDNSGDDAVSTAAAERFLEGAFQLSYLYRNGAEHEAFLTKLDTGHPPAQPLPAGLEFLEADAELAHLYRLVVELGKRFGTEPRISPLALFAGRLEAAEKELQAINDQLSRKDTRRRPKLEKRRQSLDEQIACWRDPLYMNAMRNPKQATDLPPQRRTLLQRETKDLTKNLRDSLRAEAIRIAVAAVESSRMDLYRNRVKDVLGRDVDLASVEQKILPAFLWFSAIGGLPNNTKYLRRLIEDRIEKRPHDWLRSEPAALAWAEQVRKAQPGIRLDRWRAPFAKEFHYRAKDATAEKRRRIKADLSQARMLLEKAGAKGIASESYDELHEKLLELKIPPPPERKEGETPPAPPPPAVDPSLLEEISMNLERVRLSEATPDSDFEGTVHLMVETDPFEVLFMGEYGFASCLALRGSNAWSAVSNAIDIDKVIVWAKEPGGNVVGRRLLALTPDGVLVFRTYTNRHDLAMDRVFDEFVEQIAAHCGTKITHAGRAGPLLSDRWYDDGSI